MDDVLGWLLDEESSDPAIRWQTQRDLLDEPEDVWRAERDRVAHEGWGAALLAAQDADGQWAGGAFMPADFVWGSGEPQPWTATAWALSDLVELGIDPRTPRMQQTVSQVREHARWDHDGQPYWEGEVEPCINGRTVAVGAYLGVDMEPLAARLVSERLTDGAWNCEAENGATVSSIDTTINVVEGLLEHERATGGTTASREARRTGEEYLLERGLFRRRSTGEQLDEFVDLKHPHRWRHDVLRGLDHFRAASLVTGTPPDPRLQEAVEVVRSRQRADGTWAPDVELPGRRWITMDDGVSQPSRWLTLKALRVLRWWDGHTP